MYSVLVSTWMLLVIPQVTEACLVRVESVNCTEKVITNAHFTCYSNEEEDCSCAFDNPSRSDLGWYKMCVMKNDLKLGKKKVHKRQIENDRDVLHPTKDEVSLKLKIWTAYHSQLFSYRPRESFGSAIIIKRGLFFNQSDKNSKCVSNKYSPRGKISLSISSRKSLAQRREFRQTS
ncbi:limulus clotting factor C [Nephila pilipes]|uniref:Limulus clotting factor C n=1 Tax=Nephila pilipes TaxID=299642 RepID=A0A8X6QD90_NEPPI|nr:limulus clotting factor C [Nephila pilipes]